MKFAFLGDKLESFKFDHDSTWALMVEAVIQGHEVAYAHADTLISYAQGTVQVGARFLSVDTTVIASRVGAWRSISEELASTTSSSRNDELKFKLLDDFDFVFMRKDPPIDDLYIQQLRMLTLLKRARVINDPHSLLCFNEKLVILEFPDLIVPTLVSADKEQLRGFLREQRRIVLKPLNGKGGEGIFAVDTADKNFSSIVEQLTNYGASPIMAQTYIPEIETEGDKRVILLDGEIAGVLLRKPNASENRANIAAGGTYTSTEITATERNLLEQLKPFCKEQGILLAGVDLIGAKLTEINISSPTCLQEINKLNPGTEKIETRLIKSLIL